MDHWEAYVRSQERVLDPVRQWADLEGKSPTMSEDLYRSQTAPTNARVRLFATFATGAKLVVSALKAWYLSDNH